ncbi:UbiA family prenyltransferase [Archaeoglobus sp.]
MKAIWDLLRLEHGIMYGIAVVIGIVVSSGTLELDKAILGFLTAVFCQASSFALNDYLDYEVDLKNKRTDRPLVRGDLRKEHALLLALALAPFGFVSAYLISLQAFLFALAITVLGYIYDLKLKEFGLVGNIYIAFTMSAPFLFGGIITGGVNVQVVVLSLLAFLSGLGREIMKGIEDVEGDALRDVKSVARVKGVDFAYKLSATLIALAVLLSPLPLIHYGFNLLYILPVAIADVIFIKTVKSLVRKDRDIRRLRKETLLAMLFGLLGFLLGSINVLI